MKKYTPFVQGGDIGRYQIRNLTREDIALEEAEDNAFSKVAVEWCPNGSGKGSGNVREYVRAKYPHLPQPEDPTATNAHGMTASSGSGTLVHEPRRLAGLGRLLPRQSRR